MSKTTSTKLAPKDLRLQIDNEVTRCIRQHARAYMKTEVCGVLIGEEKDGIVEVQASIEASTAAQAGTHVTFTQDAWEEIYRIKDQSYPDHRIVGWYHSHPGFGVFLSEHDTFIHRNFFSSPSQVAWVYDPHTDEEGCFGWNNGEIERIQKISIVDLNGDGEERTPKERIHPEAEESSADGIVVRALPPSRRKPQPAWAKKVFNVASYLSFALLGFLVSFFLFPSVIGIAIDPNTMQPMTVDGRPIFLGHVQFEDRLRPTIVAPSAQPATASPKSMTPTQPAPLTTPAKPASPNPTSGGK
jgi:proteasome lid subunit RPN8/RPN11